MLDWDHPMQRLGRAAIGRKRALRGLREAELLGSSSDYEFYRITLAHLEEEVREAKLALQVEQVFE